jgi:hypothetical protein
MYEEKGSGGNKAYEGREPMSIKPGAGTIGTFGVLFI